MKMKLKNNQKVFFCSDSHYNHANICRGTTKWEPRNKGKNLRDFDTLEEMNKTLVDNINKVVGEDDILFHLGDWSFGGIEQIWEFRKQIKCQNIHLILGNHDHHIEKNKILPNCSFDPKSITDDNIDTIMDGDPKEIYLDSRDHLFRVEAKDLFTSVNKLINLTIQIPTGNHKKDIRYRFVLCHFPICSWDSLGDGVMHLHGHVHLPKELRTGDHRAMDVGFDGNNLKPIELNEVLSILKDKPRKMLILKQDHHQV